MANAKKQTTESSVQHVAHAVAAALIQHKTAGEAIEASKAAHDRAELPALVKALKGAKPFDDKVFDAEFKPTLTADLVDSGKYAPESIGPMFARYKVTILGIVNGYAPQADEGLRPYMERVRPGLVQAGVYTPSNKGGRPKADKPKDDKGRTMSREDALTVLCYHDKADIPVVDALTRDHMDKLRALYSQLYPAKK